MSNSFRLTVVVPSKKPPLHITIRGEQIVALGPSVGGGCDVRIPTRTITVTESLDEVLAAWLGPQNGAGKGAKT